MIQNPLLKLTVCLTVLRGNQTAALCKFTCRVIALQETNCCAYQRPKMVVTVATKLKHCSPEIGWLELIELSAT